MLYINIICLFLYSSINNMEQEITNITETDSAKKHLSFDISDYIDNQDCQIESNNNTESHDFVKKATDSTTLQELRKSDNISLDDLDSEDTKPGKSVTDKSYKEIEDEENESGPSTREELEEFSNLIIEGIDFIFDKGAGMFGYKSVSDNDPVTERKKVLLKKLMTDVLLKHNIKFKIEYLLILVFVSYSANKVRNKTKIDEHDNKKVTTSRNFEFGVKTAKSEVKASYNKDTVKNNSGNNNESDINESKVVKMPSRSISDIIENR